jgi:hypothetical protein
MTTDARFIKAILTVKWAPSYPDSSGICGLLVV